MALDKSRRMSAGTTAIAKDSSAAGRIGRSAKLRFSFLDSGMEAAQQGITRQILLGEQIGTWPMRTQ